MILTRDLPRKYNRLVRQNVIKKQETGFRFEILQEMFGLLYCFRRPLI